MSMNNEENVTPVPKINIVLRRNTSDPPSTQSVNTSVPKRTSFKIREFCKRCFICKKRPGEKIEIIEYSFMFYCSDCLKDKMYKDAKENYFEVKNKKRGRKDYTPKKFIIGKVDE
ncbi:uncharacterized protein LOC110893206 [Helianthus annuus]|uniref:uncharacterized protein LOC110893206 n=1 Tax=Helianthus annuus TaxID=4232 RepID=UPI000B902E6C|nr:uncharacterized protein LOC110893206 [Helianthus annuus]